MFESVFFLIATLKNTVDFPVSASLAAQWCNAEFYLVKKNQNKTKNLDENIHFIPFFKNFKWHFKRLNSSGDRRIRFQLQINFPHWKKFTFTEKMDTF